MPDIEFIGSKKINRDKKPNETIHQQAENNPKSIEVKREKKSPSKSLSSDQHRRHSSSTNNSSTSINEKSIQIKIEDSKHQSNKTQYELLDDYICSKGSDIFFFYLEARLNDTNDLIGVC
jgi:hypothetical protein